MQQIIYTPNSYALKIMRPTMHEGMKYVCMLGKDSNLFVTYTVI